MKVQWFVNCLYWPEELSSFSYDYDFTGTIHALYIWIWTRVYVRIIKQMNFNEFNSKILTNQKQSETNEPSYISSW